MFKPGLTDEERQTVASLIDDRTLWTLTAECARHNDIRGLRSIEAAGRFGMDMAEAASKLNDRPFQTAQMCMPMLDALTASLFSRHEKLVAYPTPAAGVTDGVSRGLVPSLKITSEVRAFVREKFVEGLANFGLWNDKVGIAEYGDFKANRKATAAAAAAFGSATNDLDLWKRALQCEPDAGDELLIGSAVKVHAHSATFASPRSLGILLSSMAVLETFTPQDLGRRMGVHSGYSGLEDSHARNFLIRGENAPVDPDVLVWMLRLKYETSTTAPELSEAEHADAGSFVHDILDGPWSHVAQRALDEAPAVFSLNRGVTLHSANNAGLAHLIQPLVKQWVSETVDPEVVTEADTFRLIPKSHLIFESLFEQTFSSNAADDSTLQVLKQMVDQGRTEVLFDPATRIIDPIDFGREANDLDTFATHLVEKKLYRCVAFMGEHGLDFNQPGFRGKTPIELASILGDEQMSQILRSLAARRMASEALTEINHPGHSPG